MTSEEVDDTAAATPIASALLKEWCRTGRIRGNSQLSDAATLSLPPIKSLESALNVSRSMVTSCHPSIFHPRDELGGHVGWKMGWKGAFVERPVLCGPLFGSGIIISSQSSRANVSLSAHRSFCAEAEFLFVLRSALGPTPSSSSDKKDKKYTESAVWSAVDHVELCIELCGARQFTSTNKLHYVADALCSSAVVRGPSIGGRERIKDPTSLTHYPVEILVNDSKVSEGDATNNPGDSPLASLTILVNELCVERGMTIPAGTMVICGHCCQAQFDGRPSPQLGGSPRKEWGLASWKDGDVLKATFGELGSVEFILSP